MSGGIPPRWSPGGPFFEELEVGQRVENVPPVTLTSGHAAIHQAIVGDRLRLALDAGLSAAVVGGDAPLAHPALVWDVAIGQSTIITGRVIGNLFYRRLVFYRAPVIGDTLRTTTEVVALRQNKRRVDRAATGMAVLRIMTVDQERRPVLDFWRCAMLPLAAQNADTGRADGFESIPSEFDPDTLGAAVHGWHLDRYRDAVGSTPTAELVPGASWTVPGGDVVSSAPELARLSLNVASAHHDARPAGRRLVYGGHTIGVAAHQLMRVLPDLVTIVAWHACDHLGPVMERDTLTSVVELERCDALPGTGRLVHLRSRVSATRDGGGEELPVLDWRLVGVIA